MPQTPLLSLTFPNEYTDPYWSDIVLFYAELDSWLNTLFESESVQITDGGVTTLNTTTNVFAWSEDIAIHSLRSGTKITVPANNVTLLDEETLFVTAPARPITNQSLSLTAGALGSANKNQIAVGHRVGTSVHFFGKIVDINDSPDAVEAIHSGTTTQVVPVNLTMLKGNLKVENNTAYLATTKIIARSADGDVKSWSIDSTIMNVDGAISMLQFPNPTEINSTGVDWRVEVLQNGEDFAIQASGEASTTIHWKAITTGVKV